MVWPRLQKDRRGLPLSLLTTPSPPPSRGPHSAFVTIPFSNWYRSWPYLLSPISPPAYKKVPPPYSSPSFLQPTNILLNPVSNTKLTYPRHLILHKHITVKHLHRLPSFRYAMSEYHFKSYHTSSPFTAVQPRWQVRRIQSSQTTSLIKAARPIIPDSLIAAGISPHAIPLHNEFFVTNPK